MDQFNQFFDMGGYGIYVWPAYLIAAFVLAVIVILTLRRLHKTTKTLLNREKDTPADHET